MSTINLLPLREKKRLELKELAFLLLAFGVRLSLILGVFTAILITTYFSLLILVKSQDGLIESRQNDERTQRLIEIENRVKSINEQAGKILAKQEGLIVWTPVLEDLSKITPSGVYLINFSYRASAEQIDITGWARSRGKLLVFEDNLKENQYFKTVKGPLSNLIKQSDINFNFKIDLKDKEE